MHQSKGQIDVLPDTGISVGVALFLILVILLVCVLIAIGSKPRR